MFQSAVHHRFLFTNSNSYLKFPLRQMSSFSHSDLSQYISQVYNSSGQRNIFSLNVTGGGVQSLQWLFSTPGASKSVQNACIPYSKNSVDQLCPKLSKDSSYCTEERVIQLAKKAFQVSMESIISDSSSIHVNEESINVFGVACSASLTTDRSKRGDDKAFIAIYTSSHYQVFRLYFDKATYSREMQDNICSKQIINAIGETCGLFPFFDINQDHEGVALERKRYQLESFLDKLYNQHMSNAIFFPTKENIDKWIVMDELNLPERSLVFPGSFNPLHEGHIGLVNAVVKKSNSSRLVIFEIAIINADKPKISLETVYERLNQFYIENNSLIDYFYQHRIQYAISISTQPLFTAKSKLFPSCDFIIGADTLLRLFDLKYYVSNSNQVESNINPREVSIANITQAFSVISENKCKFYVGGRVPQAVADKSSISPEFLTTENILSSNPIGRLMSSIWPQMFISFSEDEFRFDISSSEIRAQSSKQALHSISNISSRSLKS